jgi:beta-galactosidase
LPDAKIPNKAPEAFLDLSWTPKHGTEMIPVSYEVAYDQFVIAGTPEVDTDTKALKLTRKGNTYTAGNIAFEVSPTTGAITSIVRNGIEQIATPIDLSLWRPLTENDAHRNGSGQGWRKEGLDSISQAVTTLRTRKNVVEVSTLVIGREGQALGTAMYSYSVVADGKLAATCTFTPDTATVHSLPRVGLTFRVDSKLCSSVEYLGRGPVETYADRKSCGRIARYTTTPQQDFHYYIVPQATGNHTDVRWVTFNDGNLTITSTVPFQFNATPYSDTNVDAAHHIYDLVDDGLITVHIDAAQTGVGTATCGPNDVLPKYRLPIQPYEFGFTFTLK